MAEVAHQDKWQLTGLEIALVSNDRSFLQTTLSQLSISLETRFPVILFREEVSLR